MFIKNEKIGSMNREIENIKKEKYKKFPNGNFRIEKYNI